MKIVLLSKTLIVCILLFIVITTSGWQNKSKDEKHWRAETTLTDTSKPGSNVKDEFELRNLNEAMKELSIQMERLSDQMKNLDIQIDKEVEEALSSIDLEKVHLEVDNAMKSVDWNKMKADVDQSLKNVDWNKMKKDIDQSLKEVQVELAKVNSEKIKEEMTALKEKLNNKDFTEEMQKEIKRSLKDARESIEEAKINLQIHKEFLNALDEDGLIDKSKQNVIELRNGQLYINEVKQSKEVTEKYKKYYNGKNNFKISMDENSNNYGDKKTEIL
jgi:hypothetical protein